MFNEAKSYNTKRDVLNFFKEDDPRSAIIGIQVKKGVFKTLLTNLDPSTGQKPIIYQGVR